MSIQYFEYLARWRQHHLAIVMTFLVLSFSWAHIMPPDLNTYRLLGIWSVLGFILLGWGLYLPLYLFGIWYSEIYRISNTSFYDASPPVYIYLLSFAIVVILSGIFGFLFAWIINSSRRWLKIVVLLNSILGFLTVVFIFVIVYLSSLANPYWDRNSFPCIHTLSPTSYLEISLNYGLMPGYFVTRFNNRNPHQVVYHYGYKDCKTIKSADEDFFWMWDDNNSLIVTHDGGEMWHTWDMNMFYQHTLGTITDVSFEDSLTGKIIIEAWSSGERYIVAVVNTTDGGLTWKISRPDPVLPPA